MQKKPESIHFLPALIVAYTAIAIVTVLIFDALRESVTIQNALEEWSDPFLLLIIISFFALASSLATILLIRLFKKGIRS